MPATLQARGVIREVTYEGAERTYTVETFTIVEMAGALGKSEMTLRRWISDDKVPAPYLVDTARLASRVYSIGEARIIHRVLSARTGYAYLTATDHATVLALNEQLQGHRAHSI